MLHKAIRLEFKEGTTLELTFLNGKVIEYDMSRVFDKIPPLRALEDRELFLSGVLDNPYGIYWTDELDFSTESIYWNGNLVRTIKPFPAPEVGEKIAGFRAEIGMTQNELAVKSGIDQSDISKIERGVANPTVSTLKRIASAMECALLVELVPRISGELSSYLDSRNLEKLSRLKYELELMAQDDTYTLEEIRIALADLANSIHV